jgi:release factor glutamine methyltransferase
MTVAEALRQGAAALGDAGSDAPALEARWLLGHSLGQTGSWIFANLNQPIDPTASASFQSTLTRRGRHEPLAYILGEAEFYGRPFEVDHRVLIPRPETELLIERVLAFARVSQQVGRSLRQILDVGTGSGAIGVTLALELPTASLIAIDVSPDALDVARRNVQRHRVRDRVTLVHCDLLGSGFDADVIVANLPYVPSREIDGLQPEVRNEPLLALDGGADGLELYRRLFQQLRSVFSPTMALFAEIGDGQGAVAIELGRQHFPEHQIEVVPDLAGKDRILEISPPAYR